MPTLSRSLFRPVAASAAVVLLLVCSAVNGFAADDAPLPFDPKKPTKFQPGKRYRLEVKPGKEAKPVGIIFVTADDETFVADGMTWTFLKQIIQEGHGDLPVMPDGTPLRVDMVDYDSDGYLDFRVPYDSGDGGLWYQYYRYDGTKYVAWPEPTDLSLTEIDPVKKTASSISRSEENYFKQLYKIDGGQFVLVGREMLDLAANIRDHVPAKYKDNDRVLVKETIVNGEVKGRKVEKR